MSTTLDGSRDSLIGTWILGQYRIVRLLGRGGMSVVYLAEQASMERFAAIKIVAATDPDAAALQTRFRREVRAASRLVHPNIITVFNFGELADGSLFLAMEYVDGASLSAVLARGPVPMHRALEVTIQCAEALGYAHSRGVVHRDFKPDNVMLTEVAGRDYAKVLDFGLARLVESDIQTRTRTLVGTPRYMSPEQCQSGTTDGTSDQYSLGLVLFEMLTGQPAVQADLPIAYLRKHIEEPLSPPSRLVPGAAMASLDPIVLRMAAKDPSARFPTMEEVGQMLRKVAQHLPPPTDDQRPLWRRALPAGQTDSPRSSRTFPLGTADTVSSPSASSGSVLAVGETVCSEAEWTLLELAGFGRVVSKSVTPTPEQRPPRYTLVGLREQNWEEAWQEWLRTGSSPSDTTLVCIDAPLTSPNVGRCAELIPNVIVGQFPLDWRLIAAALGAATDADSGPLPHIFPNCAGQLVAITSSRQKSTAVDGVLDDARAEGMRQRGLQALAELCEEMILNSVFHAPVNSDGSRRFAHLSRASEIALTPRDAPTLRWVSDSTYIGVSVRDPFGSLKAAEVFARITGDRKPQPQLDRGRKGVGMGLRIMLRAAAQLLFVIRPGISCEVAALVPKDPGKGSSGRSLAVLQLSGETVVELGDRLQLRKAEQGGVVRLALEGEINETSDLRPVFRLSGRVFLNLAAVRRINSVGVSAWLEAAMSRHRDLDLIFEECSLAFVSQMTMMPGMAEGGRVASIMAPYVCPSCGTESMELLRAENLTEELPPARQCAHCQAQLEFDGRPDEYFGFLRS